MTEFLAEAWHRDWGPAQPCMSRAYMRYGIGIEARLNLRNCAASEFASVLQTPLLLKRADFAATAGECHAWFGEFRPELFSRRSAAAAALGSVARAFHRDLERRHEDRPHQPVEADVKRPNETRRQC